MQRSQIKKPHLGRSSCCTASTNTLGRLYDGTRFFKRKQNEKMAILGMRGGPGSWIGQDYRGVYWRYWVGSGEPPAETTETKRKGGGKKGEKRAREKKSENEPKEEGWGEKWTSQIQSGTTYHNNNCSHSILFLLVISGLSPQYFLPFINLEIQLGAGVKKGCSLCCAQSRDCWGIWSFCQINSPFQKWIELQQQGFAYCYNVLLKME